MSYQKMLDTLRLVPRDVILSAATRPIEPERAFECVCGWLAREAQARRDNVDAEDVRYGGTTSFLAATYGGHEMHDWMPINHAFAYEPEALEEAFVDRVLECV